MFIMHARIEHSGALIESIQIHVVVQHNIAITNLRISGEEQNNNCNYLCLGLGIMQSSMRRDTNNQHPHAPKAYS
jgi:hypothetical protein